MAAAKSEAIELEVGERTVRISNPDRVYFRARGETKLDLANYYLSVGDGIVRALRERPCMLHRFPTGVDGEKVHQKRVPTGRAAVGADGPHHFPRFGRTADELCVTELASVIWAVQMSTVEFHPWNSRRADTEHPDEWRIDLDPMPDCPLDRVRRVARTAHEVLDELGAVGWPKTSGGKGIHIYVRIAPEHGFGDVRRAALAFAREVERRAPDDVTTTWWRKDRDPTRCSSTTTRTPATTRSPRPTRCAATWRAPCRRRSPGTRSTTSSPRTSPSPRCPTASPGSATCMPGSTTRCSPSAPLLEWAERDEQAGEETPPKPSPRPRLARVTIMRSIVMLEL